MSSLGYAIMFLLCGADGQACETVAIRASRFDTLAQCREQVGDALRGAARRHPQGARLTAACGDLDELCEWHLSWATPAGSEGGLLHRVRAGEAAPRPSAAAEATLAILCRKPAGGDCL
ncbi:MAG: hypothetical protein U1E61_16035 [Bradyrhizobium sp.]